MGLPGAGVPGMGIPGQRYQEQGPWSWDPSSGHPKNWVRRGGMGEGTQESRMVRERMPEPAPRRADAREGDPGAGCQGWGY